MNIFFIFCCTISEKEKKKMLYKLIKNYLRRMVKELWNYDSVGIRLLNFTADENVKSFLELSFVQRDEYFE